MLSKILQATDPYRIKLNSIDDLSTRPTLDRVKESLFNIIKDKIEDSTVLDLFAGSGNLGIEALSEGASYAYLVDSNYKAISVIKENITNIGITDIEVINNDYKQALKDFTLKFDIIFLDPPYNTNYIEESIKLITKYDLLNSEGIIVCESDLLDKICYSEVFKKVKEKKYGDKYIVILQKIC